MNKREAIIELRKMQTDALIKYDKTTDECLKSSYFGYSRGIEIACATIAKIDKL